ncbi:MAG: hypothetical protein DRP95_04465, partial [Candidatus Latescibacterota bacterium]
PVTVAGLKVGRVKDLKLVNGEVLATVWIDRDVELPEDSRFVVETLGAIGEKGVAVKLGRSPKVLKPGQTIRGETSPGISDILTSVGSVGVRTRELLDKFRIFFDDTTVADLSSTISGIRSIVDEAQPTLKENLARLDTLLVNLSESSRSINKLSGSGADTLYAALRDIRSGAKSLRSSAERLDSITTSLARIVSDLSRGKGTLGKLLTEEELYCRLKSLATQMDSILMDLRKHPEKYIHIELF